MKTYKAKKRMGELGTGSPQPSNVGPTRQETLNHNEKPDKSPFPPRSPLPNVNVLQVKEEGHHRRVVTGGKEREWFVKGFNINWP